MAEKGTDKEDKKDPKKDEAAEPAVLDPKYLRGLTYKDGEEREVEENGIKKKKKFPRVQPLQVGHVLSWKDTGKEITIVSKDGRKYRVKK